MKKYERDIYITVLVEKLNIGKTYQYFITILLHGTKN